MPYTPKERKLEESTYSIKVLEGTGSKAQFTRISDRLVRGSRIFWHLCEKIHEAKRLGGIWRKTAADYKLKLRELTKAFRQYERDADKEFKKQEIKYERLQKQLKKVQATLLRTKAKSNDYRLQHLRLQKSKFKLNAQYSYLNSKQEFLTREFHWDSRQNTTTKIELLARAIIGFKLLKLNKGISDVHILYLTVGHQLDAFNKQNVEDRFGTIITKYFNRDIKVLIDKGYIRRFERREFYYVTDDGKKYYTSLMKQIYEQKSVPYWKTFTERLKFD